MKQGALAPSLLRSLLTSKGVIWAGKGTSVTSWGQGTIRAGKDF